MGALEVFLIVFGIIIVAASFLFSEHLLSNDKNSEYNANIASVTKEIVEKEVEAELANVIDSKIESLEVQLDKITNEKIMSLGEYSDDVNAKISKNHDEVMFLYDMLSDKEKTLKNTVRDIEALKVSIKKMAVANDFAKQVAEKNAAMGAAPMSITSKKTGNTAKNNKTVNKQKDTLSKADTVKKNDVESTDVDAFENSEQLLSVAADDFASIFGEVESGTNVSSSKEKESTTVSAEIVTEKVEVENADKYKKEESVEKEAEKSANNNKEILELYNQGKTNMEIAKQLGLGIGEVKLVIDLFKTRK